MLYHYFVICALSLVILTSGCSMAIEGAKGIAGVSTKILEDKRKEAIVKKFDCDYDSCYKHTKKILLHIGTYVYAQSARKQMIAIYLSAEDTTPVGIFFKTIDANNTQLEVSSSSTYAKEFISEKLFGALEKSLKNKEEEDNVSPEKDLGSK